MDILAALEKTGQGAYGLPAEKCLATSRSGVLVPARHTKGNGFRLKSLLKLFFFSLIMSAPVYAEEAVLEKAVDKITGSVLELVPSEIHKDLKGGLLTIVPKEGFPIVLGEQLMEEAESDFWPADFQAKSIPVKGPLGNVPDTTKLDQESLGAGILWKINSVWWQAPYSESIVLAEVKRGSDVIRNYYFTHRRVYPVRVDPSHASEQLYRERVTLDFPTSISGFSWLHYRFRGADRDMLWYYSKAINKSRQLTSANTSDRLLSLSLSLDDVYVWSGRPDDYEVAVADSSSKLVPLITDDMLRVSKVEENSCSRLELVSAKQVIGFQGDGVPDESGWPYIFGTFNKRVGFVKSILTKVVLNHKDPYSLYGREVLYIDANSGLPYYKFVYDRRGRLWKSIIGYYTSIESGLDNKLPPRLLFMYLKDHQKRSTSLYTFYDQKVCTSLTESDQHSLSLSEFTKRPQSGEGEPQKDSQAST